MSVTVRSAIAVCLLLVGTTTLFAGHCCHRGCCCCGSQGTAAAPPGGGGRIDPPVGGAVVQSVPMITAFPMMFASMPVFPAAVQAPQAPQPPAGGATPTADCCDRVGKLEVQMLNLQRSVGELQDLMRAQNEVLGELKNRLP